MLFFELKRRPYLVATNKNDMIFLNELNRCMIFFKQLTPEIDHCQRRISRRCYELIAGGNQLHSMPSLSGVINWTFNTLAFHPYNRFFLEPASSSSGNQQYQPFYTLMSTAPVYPSSPTALRGHDIRNSWIISIVNPAIVRTLYFYHHRQE